MNRLSRRRPPNLGEGSRRSHTGESLLGALDTAADADVVVIDCPPQTLGIDLLPQLRQHGVNLPAVFLTAHALPAHEIMAFDKGAIDFIDKGRGVDVFVKRMNALGFSADFTGASMEAWKKQSANGYMTISAHDTEAKPLFPDNTLHAALDAKVWTVAAVCALFCQRVIVRAGSP